MASVQQGDKYGIGIRLSMNNQPLVPSMVTDVKIQMGNRLLSYEEGEVTFDDVNNEWIFPMNQADTMPLANYFSYIPMQVRVIIGNSIINSDVKMIDSLSSIIKEVRA